MQKKTIALAVAALVSGAAFAQSNVTLYGRADIGYTYSKSDYRKFQGIEQSQGYGGGGSHVGVRGEEPLGNGLKAVFRLEWGVNADGDGAWGSTGRYSYVGLNGKFGTVTLGRDENPSSRYTGSTAVQAINGYEPINIFRGSMGDSVSGTRWGNSIAYLSPNFSGLDFAGIYSFGEKVASNKVDGVCSGNKCADTSDAAKFGLGVRYANGPLYLTAVYQAVADDDSQKPFTGAENQGYGAKGWSLGGSYDFKVVKVYANYFRVKANHKGLAYDEDNAGSDKQTAWSLGVGIPVSSAGTVALEYAQYKDDLNNIPRSTFKISDDREGHKAKGYSLGYQHVLSKRTLLYTYVSRIDNDRSINASVNSTGVAGKKQTNFTAGISHTF
jgi:predicted porin